MKKNRMIGILMILGFMFGFINSVSAAASATTSFSGPSSVVINSNFDVTLTVGTITDANEGLAAFGGDLTFDDSKLTFVKATSVGPFTVSMNNFKMGGFGMDYIRNNTQVMKFTFTAKAEGTATISYGGSSQPDKLNKPVAIGATTKSITITQPVPKSTNAYLRSLSIAGQTMTPTFNKDTYEYRLTVPNNVSSVSISAAAEDSKARVTNTGNKNLTAGQENRFTITCTAEDGTTRKNYVVLITREAAVEVPKNNDATLKDLKVEGYNMTPVFNKDTMSYSLIVPNDANKVIVDAIKNNEKAKVEISGTDNLKVGDNEVVVKVTAEDGTIKTYTIHVTKQDKVDEKLDGDATLKSLSVSGQKLNPDFDTEVTAYTIQVPNNISSLNVDAIPNSNKAKVNITGNTNFKDGVNTISVKVTAENGTTKTYTINVIRAAANKPTSVPGKSDDSLLKKLEIKSTHLMDKTFNPNETSYSVTVPYEVDKLDLSYLTNNKKAKVSVSGNEDFKVGMINTVIVTVTAEDGSVRYYVLNVTRNSQTSGTDLKKLVVDGKDIYEDGKTKYDVTTDKDKLEIEAVLKDKDSKVEIIGNENLKEGHNTVLVKVTDKNGMVKYYELDVVRNMPKASSNKFLGLTPLTWGILLGLLLLLFLIILLLKKKKEDKKPVVVVEQPQQPTPPPVIEFKPEFNFGSKNTSDDDVVHGNFNQASEIEYKKDHEEKKRLIEAEVRDASVEEVNDPYDETITKDEIVDAIHEAIRTKDTGKLRMLLDQDELNQRKKELKRREEERKRYDEDDF